MKIKILTLVFACDVGVSFGLLGVTTASAITFDFSMPPNVADAPTETFGTPPFTLTAAGFTSPAALSMGTPNVNLFTKSMGVDEMGLGLVNDPDNEISGTSLIRIAMGSFLTGPVTFQMNSVQTGEAWQVSGSNLAASGFVPLLSGTDQASNPLPFFNFYIFNATSGNVLLASMTAAAVPGPIVGAGLPGLVVACVGLIALARRRRQRIA